MFGKCPLFVSESSEAEPKSSGGYENIQLSAGDGCGYRSSPWHRTEDSGRGKKRKNSGTCGLHHRQESIQERKEALKDET